MAYTFDTEAGARLQKYFFGTIGQHLKRREQRESFALYAHGIVGEACRGAFMKHAH
jgi:hypothetical protein